MSVSKHWLLGGWCPRELLVHQLVQVLILVILIKKT